MFKKSMIGFRIDKANKAKLLDPAQPSVASEACQPAPGPRPQVSHSHSQGQGSQ